MAEQTNEVKKSKMNPLLAVGIGCFVLLAFVGLLLSLAGGFIAKKVGVSMFQSALESKTGMKANIQDIEKGKMTFTDTKTGQTVDIGTGKLPENFPGDFPLYPDAKVVSAIAGGGNEDGFFVTFSTPDSSEKVTAFYTDAFKSGSWKSETTSNYGELTTIVVSNGMFEGSVAVSGDTSKKETGIVVTLSEKAK